MRILGSNSHSLYPLLDSMVQWVEPGRVYAILISFRLVVITHLLFYNPGWQGGEVVGQS